MPVTPKLVIPITADIKKASANLSGIKNQAKTQLGGLGGLINKAKDNFFKMAAGVAATGFAIKKFLGVAAEFEQSIANVASVSGDSRKELSALAREMGAKTVFSAKQSADAMFFLASAGLAVVDMTEVLEPSLNLAAAAQIGVAEASDLVVNSLKVFGAEMSDAGKFTDIMATAAKSANTDIPQLGEALKVSGSIAKLAGISFEKLNILIAGMADKGIKGSEAGTKLRQSFARLLKPTAAAQKVLAKFNITNTDIANSIKDPIKLFKLLKPAISDVEDATEILGVRQLAVAGLIKDGIPNLERLTEAMEGAGGAAKRMADEQLDTLQGSMKLLVSAFQEVILSGAGEGGLLDIFKSIIETLIGAVRAFQTVPGPIKAITIGILLLTPAIIAMQAALGPIGLLFIGVAAAMAIVLPKLIDFRDINQETNDVMEKLTKLQEDYKTVIEKLRDPTKKLSDVEKTLLENRKALLELEIDEQILKLSDAYTRLNEKIDENKQLQKDIAAGYTNTKEATAEAQKVLDDYIDETLKLINVSGKFDRKLLETKSGWEKLKEVVKESGIDHGEMGFILLELNSRQAGFNTILEETTKIRKLNNQIGQHSINLGKDEEALINTRNMFIETLAKKNFELFKTEKDRAKIESVLLQHGKAISNATIDRIIELRKLEKEEKKTSATLLGKTKEESEALQISADKKKFLIESGLASESELTRLTSEEVDNRIKAFQKEINERTRLIEEGNNLLKSGFDIAGSIFENFMQNRFDRRNIFSEEIAKLDEKDVARTKATLLEEIIALKTSGTAADLALADEKSRQLQRISIAEKEAKRDREIKREEAISNRKMSIAERIGSALSIAAQTAIAVGKSVAASPLTFGQPWAGFAIGSGIAQAIALFAKPLPPIPALAEGGSFTTRGPMMAMLGDNPGGREKVNVQPLKSFQSNDNSRTNSTSVSIGKLEVLSNDPEEMFNKVFEYADNMGMRLVRRGG